MFSLDGYGTLGDSCSSHGEDLWLDDDDSSHSEDAFSDQVSAGVDKSVRSFLPPLEIWTFGCGHE